MIQGSIVALVTPMNAAGAVDEKSLQRLVEFHIEQGSDALVAVGTTGESATLNEDEHCRVIELVISYAGGRIPVIAGTGANCTREAIHLTQRAKQLGADASLLVTPYYNKPTQEGLFLHYQAIADRANPWPATHQPPHSSPPHPAPDRPQNPPQTSPPVPRSQTAATGYVPFPPA